MDSVVRFSFAGSKGNSVAISLLAIALYSAKTDLCNVDKVLAPVVIWILPPDTDTVLLSRGTEMLCEYSTIAVSLFVNVCSAHHCVLHSVQCPGGAACSAVTAVQSNLSYTVFLTTRTTMYILQMMCTVQWCSLPYGVSVLK